MSGASGDWVGFLGFCLDEGAVGDGEAVGFHGACGCRVEFSCAWVGAGACTRTLCGG